MRPTATRCRPHDLPPPMAIPFRLDFFVDVPGLDRLELGSISAHAHWYHEAASHHWTGLLYCGGRSGKACAGLMHALLAPPCPAPLAPPRRMGRKPKIERDIAVFLAVHHFKAKGKKDVRACVHELWGQRRVQALTTKAQELNAAALAVAKDALFKPSRGRETHQGISEESHVSAASMRARKHLQDTAVAVLSYRSATCDEEARVLVLQRGARVERIGNHPQRCAVRGPFWAWRYGDEKAERFSDGTVEVHLKTAVPAEWLALGRENS